MSNLMSSKKDEDRNLQNVDHFIPALSEVIETADLSNVMPDEVFTNFRSRLNDNFESGHKIFSISHIEKTYVNPKIPFF